MSQPLRDRWIVVTRAADGDDALVAGLRAFGAEPIVCPTIATAPPDDWGPLDAAIADLGRYDWLIFPSARAVTAFAGRLQERRIAITALDRPRIATVGATTAAVVRERLRAPDLVPEDYQATALLTALGDVAGQRFLIPCSDIALPTLAEGLRASGAAVETVVAYRTITVDSGEAAGLVALLRAGAVDALTFTSPSTIRGFLALLGGAPDWRQPVIACIGPVTAQAARDAGLPVDVVATSHTTAGLIAALAEYFDHCIVTERASKEKSR